MVTPMVEENMPLANAAGAIKVPGKWEIVSGWEVKMMMMMIIIIIIIINKLCKAAPATVTASNCIDGRLEGSICRQRLSACDVR